MSKKPMVSVILVNYNAKVVTVECIESVLKSDYSNFEIVVVDNASKDNSLVYFKKKYRQNKKVKTIKAENNLNYTGGNNLGVIYSRGQKLVFLNNDAVVNKKWLSELVKLHQQKPNSLVQPKILSYQERKIIDNAGGIYRFPGFGSGRGHGEKDKRQYEKVKRADYVVGTCYLIDKDFFRKLGGFDEKFNIQYEDIDLSLRAKKHGGACWYCPSSIIYHRAGYTLKNSVSYEENLYHVRKNRIITILKNFTGLEKALRLFFLTAIYFLLAVQDLTTFKRNRMFLTLRSALAPFKMAKKTLIKIKSWLNYLTFNKEYPRYFEGITVFRYVYASRFVRNKEVLDIGSGRGDGTYILARKGAKHVLGIDYGTLAIQISQKRYSLPNLEFEQADARELRGKGKRFDIITAFEILEHLPMVYQEEFVRNIAQSLKPGGYCLASTPNKLIGSPGSSRPIYPYHNKELTVDEAKTLFNKYFSQVRIYGLNCVNQNIIENTRRLKKSLTHRLFEIIYPFKITHELLAYVPNKVVWFFSGHQQIMAKHSDFKLSKNPDSSASLFFICRR